MRSRDKKNLISYPSETLYTYEVMSYEWIDNLCFTLSPNECLDKPEEYIKIVKELFLSKGWDGDGKIELMWIPPFMFEETTTDTSTLGEIVWHVKQLEDGISWILHPKNMLDKTEKEKKQPLTQCSRIFGLHGLG